MPYSKFTLEALKKDFNLSRATLNRSASRYLGRS